MSRLLNVAGEALSVAARRDGGRTDGFTVTLGDRVLQVEARLAVDGSLTIALPGGRVVRAVVSRDPAAAGSRWVTVGARTLLIEEADPAGSASEHAGGLEAPMPGKVLEVCVAVGDRVSKGDRLVVVEAMKMEHAIRAPTDGVVTRIAAAEGDSVTPGTPLVVLGEDPAAPGA